MLHSAGNGYVSDVCSEIIYVFAGLTSTTATPGTLLASWPQPFSQQGLAWDPATTDLWVVAGGISSLVVLAGLQVAASAKGDPQLRGFLGQSFQVHGLDGCVSSLISDRETQLNARFSFLASGSCPPAHVPTQCWTHPGSYFTELTIRTHSGARLLLVAGDEREGFTAVELDGERQSLPLPAIEPKEGEDKR